MNNYLCLNKPLSLDDYLHKLISYLMYISDLKKGNLATITEFDFKSRLELNKTDNNYFLSFRNIEALKSINGYIDVLSDPKKIIEKIDPIEKEKYTGFSHSGLYDYNISLFFENQPIVQKDIFENYLEKSHTDFVIPYFDNNFYRFLKSVSRKYKRNVFYKKMDSYTSLLEVLSSVKNITFLQNETNKKLFDFIILFYGLAYVDQPSFDINIDINKLSTYKLIHTYKNEDNKVEETSSTSVINNKVHTFLVPSFNKECGIAEYHQEQKKGYYNQKNSNGLIITLNRLENIPDHANLVHIHHELNFFNGGSLSENTYLDLEGYINVSDKEFNIYFHTVPKWSVAEQSYETKSILRLINNKKVKPFVFTTSMFKNLLEYPISDPVLNKIKVIELGLYEFNTSIESKIANKICLIGFNTRGKSNNDLVQFLMKNTQMEINIIGKGSDIYKKINDPRLWIISDFMQTQDFVNHLKEHANVIICNRHSEASSASASYRLALSLGIPVIASNNIAHTSFFENTKESQDGFLFYDNYDEIPDLILKYQDPEFRSLYEEKTAELLKKYNIGILTKQLLE